MFPRNFSMAVAGKGKMLLPFVKRVYERFPGIVLYDRNAEAMLDSSDEEHPYIPQVAYVDVLFSRTGTKEVATIRCFHRHRFFNYDLNETTPGSKREEFLLNSMLAAVDELRELPRLNLPEVTEIPPVVEETSFEQETDPEVQIRTATGTEST